MSGVSKFFLPVCQKENYASFVTILPVSAATNVKPSLLINAKGMTVIAAAISVKSI
jgi:hypothetical protein